MSTLHNKARHFLCSRKPPPSFQSPLSLFSLYLTFDSVSTADVIRRPGARAREERLSEELANPDETTGATKADAQSSAAAAATQAATTFILKLDWVFLFREEVVWNSLRALGRGSVAFFNKNHTGTTASAGPRLANASLSCVARAPLSPSERACGMASGGRVLR